MDPYSYVLPMFTVLLGFLFTEPYQRSYFLSGFSTWKGRWTQTLDRIWIWCRNSNDSPLSFFFLSNAVYCSFHVVVRAHCAEGPWPFSYIRWYHQTRIPWDQKVFYPCACYCSKAFHNEFDGMLSTCCDERCLSLNPVLLSCKQCPFALWKWFDFYNGRASK